MRVNNTKTKKKKDSDAKRKSSLELMIFQIMQNSLKAALDSALDEILKDWDKK